MFRIITLIIILFLLSPSGNILLAQKEKKVDFNGLARAIILNTTLEGEVKESDTTSVDRRTEGEFLLDLAIDITPNEKNEVHSILRLRNEFGGFFGAGMSLEVRELYAKGIIGNSLRYHVGDMDLVMSPYTFFNPDEEGTVNEPELFKAQKEIIHYEQFYKDGNRRRMQGAKLDFGLEFGSVVRDLDVQGFVTRVRGTDFFTIPTRFVGGGSAELNTRTFGEAGTKGKLGFNFVHTWDDLKSGNANDGIRNTVYTLSYDLSLLNKEKWDLHLIGETGMSVLRSYADTVETFNMDDSFLEIGAEVNLKPQNLKIGASFIDVGPDFFSMAAQSKRVDFNRDKTFYNRIGNQQMVRMPALFDLSRDRAIYTFQLSEKLMRYDPRLSNVLPYGKATPNRRGALFSVDYTDDKKRVEAGLNGGFLKEIRGQGTFELKDFLIIKAMANVNLDQFLAWKKQLRLTLGYQFESTTRDGVPIEQIDLKSNLFEAGLQAELFSKFDLLLGAKLLSSTGNEYLPEIDMFNVVQDFPDPFIADDSEALLGAGIRYRFAEAIYLTLQYHTFSFSRETDPLNDYQINQFFILYNMNF